MISATKNDTVQFGTERQVDGAGREHYVLVVTINGATWKGSRTWEADECGNLLMTEATTGRRDVLGLLQ